MNEFIHTFSGVTYLTLPQFYRMRASYNKKDLFCRQNEKWVLARYADRGFRMEIVFTPCIEKQKRKKHEIYKAVWIVTPAKLLYPGEPMKKLFTPEEYRTACTLLADIFQEIQKTSGVNFLYESKLYRVDVTKDITTPSETFSQEVIRLAKIAISRYGYYLLDPDTLEEKKEEWKDENGVFFHNDNQEVQAKIYNKEEDLRIHGYDTDHSTGLLRFELALKRTFLREKEYLREKYIVIEDLPDILSNILAQAPDLMQKHITDPLWNGAMVSKDIQKKFIRKYCDYKTDSAKYKKMIAYRKACNRVKNIGKVKDNPTVKRYFADMKISPLCCSDEMGYIPAFADLLNEREDMGIREFVEDLRRN